jgi:hypothetical protein
VGLIDDLARPVVDTVAAGYRGRQQLRQRFRANLIEKLGAYSQAVEDLRVVMTRLRRVMTDLDSPIDAIALRSTDVREVFDRADRLEEAW